ncbi:MAG TPA: septum site-determining protein Ssd [Nocardioidaceae bacterium]
MCPSAIRLPNRPSADGVDSPCALVVTHDAELAADVLRLCAAAGVTPDLAERTDVVRGQWRTATCVLLGSDVVDTVARLSLPRRGDVVVVTRGEESTALLRHAVHVGAMRVVRVSDGQDWLVAWLADTAEGVGGAEGIAVIGARGGAGASTIATTLALRAGRRARTCLIDADPLSGGLELLLGSEHREGLRWPDVAVTRGRIGAAAFRAALPSHRGVTVLSWAPGTTASLDAATMRCVLAAAARSSDVVVVDLPRRLDEAADEGLAACRHIVLVTTDDVRSVASASTVLARLGARAADVELVVRTVGAGGPAPEVIADSLGLQLAGVVPTRRCVARSIDDGLGPPGRGRLVSRCDTVLARLLTADATS